MLVAGDVCDGCCVRVQGANLLLLVPAISACLLCETAFVRRHARVVVLAAAIGAIIVIICLVTWDGARDAWLRFSAFRQFLEVAHSGMSPTAYDGAYAAIDPELRAACRDDTRPAGADPGRARRVGARASDSLGSCDTTHRLARSRYVSDLVCRGLARNSAFRADVPQRCLRRVSAAAICSDLCLCRRLDSAVRRARVTNRWSFSRQPSPRTFHDVCPPRSRSSRWRGGTTIRPDPALPGECVNSTPGSNADSSTQRHSSEHAQLPAIPSL